MSSSATPESCLRRHHRSRPPASRMAPSRTSASMAGRGLGTRRLGGTRRGTASTQSARAACRSSARAASARSFARTVSATWHARCHASGRSRTRVRRTMARRAVRVEATAASAFAARLAARTTDRGAGASRAALSRITPRAASGRVARSSHRPTKVGGCWTARHTRRRSTNSARRRCPSTSSSHKSLGSSISITPPFRARRRPITST